MTHTFFQLLQAGNRDDLFDGILKHARSIGKSEVEIVSKSNAPSSEHIIHQTMDDILKSTQGEVTCQGELMCILP